MKKFSLTLSLILIGYLFPLTTSAATYTNSELIDKWIKCLEDAKEIKPTIWWMISILKTFDSCQDYNFAAVENSESKASEKLIKIIEVYQDILWTLKQQEYIVQQLYKYKIIPTKSNYVFVMNNLMNNRCKYLYPFMEKDVKNIFSIRSKFSGEQKNALATFKKAACDNSHIVKTTSQQNPTIQDLTFVKWLLDKTGGNIYSIWTNGIFQFSWWTSFSKIIEKKVNGLSRK